MGDDYYPETRLQVKLGGRTWTIVLDYGENPSEAAKTLMELGAEVRMCTSCSAAEPNKWRYYD